MKYIFLLLLLAGTAVAAVWLLGTSLMYATRGEFDHATFNLVLCITVWVSGCRIVTMGAEE